MQYLYNFFRVGGKHLREHCEVSTRLCRMSEVEPPFRPRVKIVEKQKYFQNIPKHTYLKGPFDKVTSVAIPIALAGTTLFLIVS